MLVRVKYGRVTGAVVASTTRAFVYVKGRLQRTSRIELRRAHAADLSRSRAHPTGREKPVRHGHRTLPFVDHLRQHAGRTSRRPTGSALAWPATLHLSVDP